MRNIFQRSAPPEVEAKDSPVLEEPLIVGSAPKKRTMATRKSVSESAPDSLASLADGRAYASSGPRIMLEIMTARSATIIILTTWVIFAISFAVDFYTTYKSFHSSNYALTAFSCSSYNSSIMNKYNYFSCGNDNAGWNATVTDLSNVISFSMNVQQTNLTSILSNNTASDLIFRYNVEVWTCYNQYGCGDNFNYDGGYSTDGNAWQQVLVLMDEEIDVHLSTSVQYDDEGARLSIQLIATTFQNQEAIPTNGLVKSYFFKIDYTQTPYDIFLGNDPTTQDDITYTVNIVRAPGNRVLAGINVALLIITIGVLCAYCTVIYKHSTEGRILSEQKWLIAYFLLVILFQNPVYCVIVWYHDTAPSATAAYAAFFLNNLAQSGLFTLWLLFADSYNRKLRRKIFFYTPKVLIGLLIFIFGLLVQTYQFPSLAVPRSYRSSVQAVQNWSTHLQVSFVACTIIYLILIWVWTIYWSVNLVLTGRAMARLPYMSTRYMQLSYRFFSLQATLVTFYYIAQYLSVIYFLSKNNSAAGYSTSLTVLTDNINVLFRQQFQLFGKTLFLTTYAMVLAFMFLPPDVTDSSGFYATVAATYAVSEDEHRALVATRKSALKAIKRNLINQVTRLDQLVRAKEDVFCVEVALALRDVSFQSYYDSPEGAKTASAFGDTQDLEGIGFELVEEFYDSTHEVYCIICRELKPTKRIVVSFRGTASKKQMEDNMNYTKRPVDFFGLGITSLDHLDRLALPKHASELDDFELESVEDEDEAIALYKTQKDLAEEERAAKQKEDGHAVDTIESTMDADLAARKSIGVLTHMRSVSSQLEGDGGDDDQGVVPRETIIERAGQVGGNLTAFLSDAVGVTNQGIDLVLNTTGGVMTKAARNTPGLKQFVTPNVHSGFWEAYTVVRGFIHGVLRAELVKNPTTVFFTGHSLGGALASFAAIDFKLTSLPRINNYLKYQAKLHLSRLRHLEQQQQQDLESGMNAMPNPSFAYNNSARPSIFSVFSSDNQSVNTHATNNSNAPNTPPRSSKQNSTNKRNHLFFGSSLPTPFSVLSSASPQQGANAATSTDTSGLAGYKLTTSALNNEAVFIKKIKIRMYNFGAPKVGNGAFQQLYDKEVPASYRVIIDGDLVPGLPPSRLGFAHIGTEILLDSLGVGTIIIDPSFVERWLRTHMKSSISMHSLLVYRKGLLGVQFAAEALKEEVQIRNERHSAGNTTDFGGMKNKHFNTDIKRGPLGIDPTRLALMWRNRVQIEKLVDEHEKANDSKAKESSNKKRGGLTPPTPGGTSAANKESTSRSGGSSPLHTGSYRAPAYESSPQTVLTLPQPQPQPSAAEDDSEQKSSLQQSPPLHSTSLKETAIVDTAQVQPQLSNNPVVRPRTSSVQSSGTSGSDGEDTAEQAALAAAARLRQQEEMTLLKGAQDAEYHAQSAEHIATLMGQIRSLQESTPRHPLPRLLKPSGWVKRSINKVPFLKKSHSREEGKKDDMHLEPDEDDDDEVDLAEVKRDDLESGVGRESNIRDTTVNTLHGFK